MIRSSVSTSTSQSTITRRNHNLDSTTTRSAALLRLLRHHHRRHKSGNAVKPTFAIRLRQANSSWFEIPCRRAVADASRRAEKLSSTIRSFSVADHRCRRPVLTISRRLICRLSLTSSIPTISYMPDYSARRPTPGGYRGNECRRSIPVSVMRTISPVCTPARPSGVTTLG
jgi:hypothetical protein